MSLQDMLIASEVERAIARKHGGADPGAAAAPAYAPGKIAAGAPNTPEARAAYESFWEIADKIFRIEFMNGSTALKTRVLDILNDEQQGWRHGADLTFRDVRTHPGSLNVRLVFFPGVNKSRIGKSSRSAIDSGANVPSMHLGFQPDSTVDVETPYGKFLVLHEFGHALGMIHEHQTPASTLRFKENDPRVLQFWRSALGGVSDEEVRFNVFRRWNSENLTKFVSQYDSKSIMHYAFAAWNFVNNAEVVQNYVLSHLDLAFSGMVYPTPNGPKVKLEDGPTEQPTQTTTPATPMEIAIDGGPAKTNVVPNQPATFKLRIAASQAGKPYTIYSEGSTQVVLQLLGPNDANKDATPADVPGHGTYDLTNDAILATLAEGEYVVKAQHVAARGGGPTSVAVKSGDQFKGRLLKSNLISR